MEVTSTQAIPTQTTPKQEIPSTVSQIQVSSTPTKVSQIQLPPSPQTQSRTELKLGRKVFRVAIKPNPTATNAKAFNDCLTGFLKQRISAYLSNPKDPAGIWLSNSKVTSKDNSEVVHEVNSEVILKTNHEVNSKVAEVTPKDNHVPRSH